LRNYAVNFIIDKYIHWNLY